MNAETYRIAMLFVFLLFGGTIATMVYVDLSEKKRKRAEPKVIHDFKKPSPAAQHVFDAMSGRDI